MAQMYYFLPDRKTASARTITDLGLSYIRDGSGPGYAGISHGPEGRAGVAFSCQPGGVAGAASADWSRLRGIKVREEVDDGEGGRELVEQELVAWVGHDPSARPGPKDLARKTQQGGHWVGLGDGNLWLVPVARALDGSAPFPKRLDWDGSDWSEGDVVDGFAYRELFEEACSLWDSIKASGEGPDLDLGKAYSVAAKALAINYQLGPNEIAHLGLFTTTTASESLLALIDWPLLLDLKKKGLLSDPQPSAPGSAG